MQTPSVTPHILESLRNPSAYPDQTGSVEFIQTHVSWLFLTDTHVYKIKKPVDFGFLDFSTPERRHFYCLEELRLNRRLCPDIYEDVVELRETDTGAAFSGSGRVLDFAVVMKRLPADRMLDRLIEAGEVTAADIRNVAVRISRFHSAAATSPYISGFGTLEQIRFNWQENFTQTAGFRQTTLPAAVCDTIRSCVEAFMISNQGLFATRVDDGRIRECDGDIHLGNICLSGSTAYIFDCIEFNERFRYSDTAADIAFLLMDLEYRRRPDLAEATLAAYVADSADDDCIRLIPFYKIYRAFVRGKVESLQLLDSGITQEEHDAAAERAARYFRLAYGYCVRSRLPPALFITCGTMGCGKSTLAGQLAFELGLTVFDSDSERKLAAGITPATAVHVPFGEDIYSQESSRATYRRLEDLADAGLSAGRSVIIDAGFASAAGRSRFARLAASRQVRFVILHVTCDPEKQRQRLIRRASEGISVSDGRLELLDRQGQFFEVPRENEGLVISVSTDDGTDAALDMVYERLSRC